MQQSTTIPPAIRKQLLLIRELKSLEMPLRELHCTKAVLATDCDPLVHLLIQTRLS